MLLMGTARGNCSFRWSNLSPRLSQPHRFYPTQCHRRRDLLYMINTLFPSSSSWSPVVALLVRRRSSITFQPLSSLDFHPPKEPEIGLPAMESPSEKAPPDDSNPLGLSDAELNSLDEQIDLPPSDAGYLAIYRYSTTSDLVIMFFSAVMASVAGASLPLMTVRLLPHR